MMATNQEAGSEDHKKQLKSLNLVESVIQIIKKDNRVVSILEKTVSITKGATDSNQDRICRILVDVLNGLKGCKTGIDLEQFENNLRGAILPKELKSLEVEHTVYEMLINIQSLFRPIPKLLSISESSDIALGRMIDTKQQVALKKPASLKASKLLLNEAIVLSKLKHHNILPILGFQTDGVLLITPFMPDHNMWDFVQKKKPSVPKVLKYLIGVSKGMQYLVEKSVLHRNLRLEHVLIDDAKKESKICDFKYSQFVGYTNGVYKCNQDLAFYNVSPESFATKEFRMESDVYAMGLLIWDAFHREEVLSALMKKEHLKEYLENTHAPAAQLIPQGTCPKAVFQFITEGCLLVDYKSRPSFKTITETLKEICNEKQF